MITVEIDSTDRTSVINFGSLIKKDNINQLVDTGGFTVDYHDGQTFRPEANSLIEIYNGVTKTFSGTISRVTKQVTTPGQVRYHVQFKDHSYDFGRILINEGYDDMTVNAIIADIVSTVNTETGYSFTTTNVDCDLVITKIRFDRVTADECIKRLAQLTGYSFYIDYDKDLHFFERNTEAAPFNISDGDGNHIVDSLAVTNDLTQIRNRVYIRGAEIEGEERTETYQGDGQRKFFKLSNKFSSKPTVEVDSVAQDVGIDFLDNEADYDCFWDYNQQYIRFKDTTIPSTVDVDITGTPLYTPEFLVEDPDSISTYGIFEFAKTDKSIQSREQAVDYADAELTAYKNGLIEGEFESYEDGLRSGQIITITSTLLNVSEDFLIQSVSFKMITPERYIYHVELATLRTIGLIEFLIDLIRSEQRILQRDQDVVIEKYIRPKETIAIEEQVDINTDDYPQSETLQTADQEYVQALDFPIVFVAGPYIPDPSDGGDYKRVLLADNSPVQN